MSIKPITIYLAGPMDAEEVESFIGWRIQVWEYLESYITDGYIRILDPCRRPHDKDLQTEEVALMDIKDVNESDMLLADIRCKPRENAGTSIEMYHCSKISGKPVFGWYDEEHAPTGKRLFIDWVVTRQFDSLNKAMDHIVNYHLHTNNTIKRAY
jgi:nucleoside 2-deoxyribosyltransferase